MKPFAISSIKGAPVATVTMLAVKFAAVMKLEPTLELFSAALYTSSYVALPKAISIADSISALPDIR